MTNAILCYVRSPWAFFTTQPLKDQWGDDWNDKSFEHNSGDPYCCGPKDKKQWQIIKIAYDGDFATPDDGYSNSPWSVEQINSGAISWLRSSQSGKNVVIPAGTTLELFIGLIHKGGGRVYMEGK
jgi:hypothetical protein